MAVTKNVGEEIEFFVPAEGLELDHYVSLIVPENGKGQRLRKQAIHHLARYYWAAEVLASRKPGTVLDVASGSGYGTSILTKLLPAFTIIGGDYDERAVRYAKANFNGRYQTADIVSWTDPKTGQNLGKFDYIVSFDTLEHLLFRELALINFAENLNSDGALIFSTPAKKENLLNPGWEHHKIEYSFQHLFNLMKRFFSEVHLPDNDTLPCRDFWVTRVNNVRQEYLLRGNPMVCEKPIKFGFDWPPRLD